VSQTQLCQHCYTPLGEDQQCSCIWAEHKRLREKVEMAIHALTHVLPISGSWNSGYSVPDHIDPKVIAMPEEWGDAALAVADLHAELTGNVA
jgi:hypothetical protein